MAGDRVEVVLSANIKGLIDGLGQASNATRSGTDAMRAGLVSLGGAAQALQSPFARLTSLVDGLKGPLVGLGATLGGGKLFSGAVQATLDWTSEVKGLASQLGVTTEKASAIAMALGDIGSSTEVYRGAVFKLQGALRSQEDALSANGVATRDAKGAHLEIGEVMQNGLKRLGELKEGYDRNALAMLMFGRSAMEMQGLQRLTNERISEAAQKARELGMVVTSEGVSSARAYKGAINDVGDVMQGLQVRIGAEVLPKLTKLGVWFGEEGPKLIGPTVGALTTLGDVVSSTGFKLGAGLLALNAVGPSLLSAGAALGTFGTTFRTYTGVLAAEGAGRIAQVTGAVGAMVNPWLVAAVAIGGAAYALERWSTQEERATDAAVKASAAARANQGEYTELTSRIRQLDAVLHDSTASAEEKKKAQEQMNAAIEQFKALSPALKDALVYEANGHLNVAETLKKANEQRREALRLEGASLALNIARLEEKRRGLTTVSTPVAAMTGDPATDAQIEANLRAAALADKRVADVDAKLANARKELADLNATIAGPVTPKPGGGTFVDSNATQAAEKAAAAHATFMERLRAEQMEGEVRIVAEGEAKILEIEGRSEDLTQRQFDEEVEAVRAMTARKVEIYRSDRQVDMLRERMAEVRNDGEQRLELQRQIIAREVAIHGDGSEKVLAEKRKLAVMSRQVDQESAKLQLEAGNAARDRDVSLLDVEAQTIQRRRALGELSAGEEFAALRELEDRKLAIRFASVDAGLKLDGLTLEETRKLLDEEQALYVQHFKAVTDLEWRAREERQRAVEGYVGPTVSAATNGLAAIVQQTQGAGDAIKTVWNSILSTVLNAISKMVTEWIAAKVTMAAIDVATGGAGGGFSTVAPTLITGMLEGKASGGPIAAGKTVLVGEDGPEPYATQDGRVAILGLGGPGLFTAPAAGRIFPSGTMKAASAETWRIPAGAIPREATARAAQRTAPDAPRASEAFRASAAARGGDVHVTFQVSAIDGQNVAQHLERHAGTYAEKISRMIHKGQI